MDVSATGPSLAVAAPQANVGAVTGDVAPVATRPDVGIDVTAGVGAPPAAATPQTQTTPAPVPGQDNRGGIAPAVAKLFSLPAPPEPISLDVSYRVQRDPNEIVTVFSDPKTGQEVAQFPPEILIHLANFFDQPTGVTLDRNA